jgi:tellurite resistance protein
MEEFLTILAVAFIAWVIVQALKLRSGFPKPEAKDLTKTLSIAQSLKSPSTTPATWPELDAALPAAARRSSGRWVSPGEDIRVSKYQVSGGLLYFGDEMASVSGSEPEPALIRPKLGVDANNPNLGGESVPYWPSYSHLDPRARAAYLLWLSSGRRAPNTYIGYVFLFFYGLERRVLCDARASEQAKGDIPGIAAEVRDLLIVYGDNSSFRGYGRRFLEVCETLASIPHGKAESDLEVDDGIPFALKLELGRLAQSGSPIPGEVALRWIERSPEIGRRVAMERCRVEFRRLFSLIYRERYHQGMIVEPNRTRLSLAYKPASHTFAGEIRIDGGDLPDVTAVKRPIVELGKLVDACLDRLEPYSRWLGRNPAGRGTIEAVALLPRELAADEVGGDLGEFKDWLTTAVGTHPAYMKTQEFTRHWPSSSTNNPGLRQSAVQLSRVLEAIGFGIEPDARFQGPTLDHSENVVLFRLADEPIETPSAEYVFATLMARLGIAIAAADGEISREETAKIVEVLKEKLTLAPGERVRLTAHMTWLVVEGASLVGLKKRIEALRPKQRELIAQLATMVALADGRITKDESNQLAKVYKLLGLDPDRAYQDVHALGAGAGGTPDSDLVTVRQAHKSDGGYAVPPQPTVADEGLVLDMGRLRTKLAESREVAAILKDVFVDEEPASAVAPALSVSGLAGLDAPHTALMRRLTDRSTVTRAEWESWCAASGLLPDGAVDRINEAALDLRGDPILAGEDPIEVDVAVLKEMVT